MTETKKSLSRQDVINAMPEGRLPYILAASYLGMIRTRLITDDPFGRVEVIGTRTFLTGTGQAIHVLADAAIEGTLEPPLSESVAEIITGLSAELRQESARYTTRDEGRIANIENDYLRSKGLEDVAILAVRTAIDSGSIAPTL